MDDQENYLYFYPPDPVACEKCEVNEARIQSLHQNSADAMRENIKLKAELLRLQHENGVINAQLRHYAKQRPQEEDDGGLDW